MATQIASMFVRIGADLSGLNKGLREAQSGLSGAANRIGDIGNKLTMGVTLPIVGLGTAVAKMGADFEQQMGLLQIAAKATGDEMQAIEAYAKKMGAETIYGARDMAEAMTEFFKAGMGANEIMGDMSGQSGALKAAVDLATASNLELAEASEAISIAMATFGLNTEDAVGITNNFVQAADASVAEVRDLVMAMANVGPVAAQFGWSLEDTNTALAILSERGITGSEAGTALRSMMTNLMRDTNDVQDTLNDLNISLYDQQGALKPLPIIIGQLRDAMANMSEEEKNLAIQTLAGTYGMRAMNTLLQEGLPGWREMEGEIANAATAAEVAEVKTSSFKGVLEELGGAVETAGLALADVLLPPLKELIRDWITPAITKIGELNPKWIKWGLGLLGVGAAAGPVLKITSGLLKVISLLANPVGILVAAIGFLTVAYYKNWLNLRTLIDNFKGRGGLGWFLQAFGFQFPKVAQAVTMLSDAVRWLGAKVRAVLEFFDDFLTALVRGEGMADVFKKRIQALSFKFPRLSQLFGTAADAADSIATAIEGVIKKIDEFIEKLKSVKLPDWLNPGSPPPLADALRDIAEAARVADRAISGLSMTGGAGVPSGMDFATGGAAGQGPIVMVPIFMSPDEVSRANGDLDYRMIAQRIMRETVTGGYNA